MEKRTFVKLNENSAFGDRYNLSFILQVVDDVENGRISKEECKRKYGIKGNTTVLNWLRKYGKLVWAIQKEIKMKEEEKQPLTMEEELKLLRIENRKLKVKLKVHEKLEQMAKRDLNIYLKKNYEQDVLKSLGLKTR